MILSELQEKQMERSIAAAEKRNVQISTAEIGTGGQFGQLFAASPAGRKFFSCGMVLSDPAGMNKIAEIPSMVIQKYGMDTRESAAALAVAALKKSGADVGAGVSGPADAHTPLWVALAVRENRKIRILVDEARNDDMPVPAAIQEKAVSMLIDMIDGYFSEDQRILAEFEPISKWKRCMKVSPMVQLCRFFVPWKGDSASDIMVKVLLFAAVLIGGWSAAELSGDAAEIYHSTQVLENAVETMEQQPDRKQIRGLPEGYLENFAAAYEVNPEIAGWLDIPGTNINLPVLQHEDNTFYLDHNFEGEYDPNGVPFMDFRNNLENPDNNTLIYGHNWESGQMFHSLLLYRDTEFYRQNPIITFDTVYEQSQWKVISCFEAVTDANIGEVFNYWNYIRTGDPDKQQWYLDEILARSYFTTTVDVNIDDRLLTLQTCANDRYNRKICLVARKLRPGESAEVDVQHAEPNGDRVAAVIY